MGGWSLTPLHGLLSLTTAGVTGGKDQHFSARQMGRLSPGENLGPRCSDNQQGCSQGSGGCIQG